MQMDSRMLNMLELGGFAHIVKIGLGFHALAKGNMNPFRNKALGRFKIVYEKSSDRQNQKYFTRMISLDNNHNAYFKKSYSLYMKPQYLSIS